MGAHIGAPLGDRNAELLQVVRYEVGQEYAPHHDFGDSGAVPGRPLDVHDPTPLQKRTV